MSAPTLVRFPCEHGYHRPHLGEGGPLDNLKHRNAKWCKGGHFIELRQLDPSRAIIIGGADYIGPVYIRTEPQA
jgi:hypothetical protein